MRIQVISDLHQEFGFIDISLEGADLVILAGDINLAQKESSGSSRLAKRGISQAILSLPG